jgi:hypothetical protein
MERLYKDFGFMQNHFHPQNQQRHKISNTRKFLVTIE